jgi:DnaJ-class molecular chaperone
MDYDLDYITAACGGLATVETVHGLKQVKIQPGTQSG